MQAASDAFLGSASSGTHHFYVRQFKDMKASAADLDGVDPAELRVYGRDCWLFGYDGPRASGISPRRTPIGTGPIYARFIALR
jgi:hypothetical protein